MKHVIIVGGGFAGLTAARQLGRRRDLQVTLIDRNNHHLFQPLLYQVAMAGLSPAEIAAPIRSLVSNQPRVAVRQEEVKRVDLEERKVHTAANDLSYDYLILACGAGHSYFGRSDWEPVAPGLKNLPQALEIRRRVLAAFEAAELEEDTKKRKALLTFVVVGGGPTGVELAGALGEMSRYTLARDFQNIDPKLARVILVEAGERVLPMFSEELTARAMRDLEALGVQVWTTSLVSEIDDEGVTIGDERVSSRTVLWAAGVQGAELGKTLGVDLGPRGRVPVSDDLSLSDHPEVFVAGDQALVLGPNGHPLPGVAPVAMQQGRHVAQQIANEVAGKAERQPFKYVDKGQMATIGRSKAVCEIGRVRFGGFFAWLTWLVVHIYFLVGFKNRLFVVIQWAWSYLTYRRGARLIVSPNWQAPPPEDP